MADSKLTGAGCTLVTSYLTTDILYLVTDPGGTPVSSRMTFATLIGKLPAAPLPSSAAGFDIGSATLPWKDLWIAGGSGTPGTNNYRLTGTATGARVVTLPDSSTTIPIIPQVITVTGPTAARTWTVDDAALTLAARNVDQTFTGVNTFTPTARSSGVAPFLKITTPADTGQTADAEFPGIVFGGDASHATVIRTGADGTTYALQREYIFVAPTYAYAGATTATTAVTLDVTGAPVAGSNATLTNRYAQRISIANAGDKGLQITANGGSGSVGNLFEIINTTGATGLSVDRAGNMAMGSGAIITLGTSGGINGNSTAFVGGTGTNRISIGRFNSVDSAVSDAGTTTLVNAFTAGHQSSGTPGVGFGSGILFNINSSTTADQNAAQIGGVWSVATHASRTGDLAILLVESAAALAERARFRSEGGLKLSSANGQSNLVSILTENTTLSTGGATTDTAINLPANSIILSVTARITAEITGVDSTAVQIGDATVATRFGSMAALTAGTTTVGLNHMQGSVAADNAGPVQVSAAAVRITLSGGADNTPSAGAVRITIHYIQLTAATS